MEHLVAAFLKSIVEDLDDKTQKTLAQLVPNHQALYADPAGFLTEHPLTIGPARKYGTRFSSSVLLAGLSVLLAWIVLLFDTVLRFLRRFLSRSRGQFFRVKNSNEAAGTGMSGCGSNLALEGASFGNLCSWRIEIVASRREEMFAREALEHNRHDKARELLDALARGAPSARLTKEAQATLKRLGTR